MRFSLTSLVKMIAMMAILACLMAIGLSRMTPAAARFRMKSPPIYSPINGFVVASVGPALKFLDTSDGALRTLKLPEGQHLEYASCSPWVDDRGEYQIAGRWVQHQLTGDPVCIEELGIARYAMPSGRLISKNTVDVVPASRPCWYPGNVSRILYAGGDGRLYQVKFNDKDRDFDDGLDSPDDFLGEPDTEVASVEIRWGCVPPGGRVMIMDPFWSDDPRLGGRLIAALSIGNGDEPTRLPETKLWWLKLNAEGTAIVEAVPLSPDPSGRSPEPSEGVMRHPTIATTPSGELTLAYLWQRQEEYGHWELRLESIEFDAMTHRPMMLPESTKILTAAHLGVMPRFSVDGRWVYGILRNDDPSKRRMGFAATVVRYSSAAEAIAPSRALAGPSVNKG